MLLHSEILLALSVYVLTRFCNRLGADFDRNWPNLAVLQVYFDGFPAALFDCLSPSLDGFSLKNDRFWPKTIQMWGSRRRWKAQM